jgi:hypothetical protein
VERAVSFMLRLDAGRRAFSISSKRSEA